MNDNIREAFEKYIAVPDILIKDKNGKYLYPTIRDDFKVWVKSWQVSRNNIGVVPPNFDENGKPILYTPPEYTAWMKAHVSPDWEMPDDMPVWCVTTRRPVEAMPYSVYVDLKILVKAVGDEIICVVATEAGRPSVDWRPE